MQQAGAYVRSEMEVRRKFNAARESADLVHKPLLVVGGPYGETIFRRSLNWPAHPYGDVCADINPDSCLGAPRFQQLDIKAMPFKSNEFGAVFCSHVLEHMWNLEEVTAAWHELHRVADSVYVCMPRKDSLGGWIATGHHLWVYEVGSGILSVEERHPPKRKALVGAVYSQARAGGSSNSRIATTGGSLLEPSMRSVAVGRGAAGSVRSLRPTHPAGLLPARAGLRPPRWLDQDQDQEQE